MQAYTQLEKRACETREVRKSIVMPKKPFEAIGKALNRMVTFHNDHRLREMGNPYIRTE